MSTTQVPARKKERSYATLYAQHASEPTVELLIWQYAVRPEGKNMSRYRTPDDGDGVQQVLMVPPMETWTRETLRMVLWEMTAFLKGGDEYQYSDQALRTWALVAGIEASVRPAARGKRERQRLDGCQLWVELPTSAVCVYVETTKFSEPMTAFVLSLLKAPFPLAGIEMPDVQEHGDDADETLDDVETQQRLTRKLRELKYLSKDAYALIERLINRTLIECGGDDE